MNPFDLAIVGFLNSFARRSPAFDATVEFINTNDLMKGGVIMAIVWWGWFARRDDEARSRRSGIMAALLAGFVSLIVGRLIASALPFRPRPLHETGLDFVLPYGASPYELKLWSSFPSQHTLFFTALGAGMLYVSPLAGAAILLHTFVFIALPRVYLGLHYPSDILGGALIGCCVGLALGAHRLRDRFAPWLLKWHDRHPAAFYATMFILTLQLSTMFSGALALLRLIVLGPKTS